MKNVLIVTRSLLATTLFTAAILAGGCQTEDRHDPDPVLTNSTELEDYIIAATDLNESLKIFERELNKIDFSTLETVFENGREVTYLPNAVRSIDIESKLRILDEKKAALFQKYPEFASMQADDFSEYINKCIQESAEVANAFLTRGINIYQPLTRYNSGESYQYDSMSALVGQLYSWCLSDDFVEVSIIVYADGSAEVYRNAGNTAFGATMPSTFTNNSATPGVYYYGGRAVSYVAHPHRYSNTPSAADIAYKTALQESCPGLTSRIYYNGAFHNY